MKSNFLIILIFKKKILKQQQNSIDINIEMTPAYASIAFVAIAIFISVLRDILFPQTLSSSSESTIAFDRMYTVSNKKYTPPNKNYGSLFESYYQFHADQKYRNQKKNISNTIKLQDYNSYVLKKSIINDEHTILCNEDFLITISEGISCKEINKKLVQPQDSFPQVQKTEQKYPKTKCQWKTHFSIYELPLLKQQTKQVVSLTGQIGLSRYLTQDDKKKRLFCKKVRNRQQYVMNFPMSHLRNSTNDGQFWSLNDLYITKINQTAENLKKKDTIIKTKQKNNKGNQDNKSYQESSKSTQKRRASSRTQKERQSKQRESFTSTSPNNKNNNMSSSSQSIKQFQVLHYTYKLQFKSHRPFIHYCDGFCTTYVTREEPWIIRYNCDDKWNQINILDPKIQKFIFSKLNSTSLIPPFQRQNIIKPRYLYTFQSQITQFKLDCSKQGECSEIQIAQSDHYLTYVFDHVNSKYRVQKFIMQLTFTLEENNFRENIQFFNFSNKQQDVKDSNFKSLKKQTQRKISKQDKKLISTFKTSQQQKQYGTSYDRLRSHSIIVSQINPKIKVYTDCQINGKVDTHYQRYYDKYYWLYEHRPLYSIQRWGLMCIIVFDLDSTIRIAQIQDILYSKEIKKKPLSDYYNVKDFKRFLNYKDAYEKQIDQLVQIYKTYLNSTNDLNTSFSKDPSSQNSHQFAKSNKNLKRPIIQDIEENQFFKYINHLQKMQEDLQNHMKKINNEPFEKEEDNETMRKTKTLKKSKIKKQQKTVKERKESQKRTKYFRKLEKNKNFHFTPVQIKGKKSMNSFYNKLNTYDKLMSYPHVSQTRRHRFPLPFQLSLTNNMKIISSDPKKPLILFSAVKNYLFTYKETTIEDPQSKLLQTKVDYRYMILGVSSHSSSKIYLQKFKTIDQVKNVIEQINKDSNSKADNFLKSVFEAENDILNEIKTISSIPVEKNSQEIQKLQGNSIQDFKRYVVVVWGWGIQVYEVNWQKNMKWKYDQKHKKVQMQLNASHNKTYISMGTFIPFVQLFATVYCMFQILITSR